MGSGDNVCATTYRLGLGHRPLQSRTCTPKLNKPKAMVRLHKTRLPMPTTSGLKYIQVSSSVSYLNEVIQQEYNTSNQHALLLMCTLLFHSFKLITLLLCYHNTYHTV